MADNPLMKTMILGLVVTAVGIMMIFGPGIVGIDGFDGGFAISFVGLFAAILGFSRSRILLSTSQHLGRDFAWRRIVGSLDVLMMKCGKNIHEKNMLKK